MKALVVDDHPFIREAVRHLLEKEHFDVIEAENGAEAVQMAREHTPELILLDITMPMLDGLRVMERLKALELPHRILILTAHTSQDFALRCQKAGAAGFLSKSHATRELSNAVSTLMSGYTYFPQAPGQAAQTKHYPASEELLVRKLSDRELTVLIQLANGSSNKEIGERMLLSSKTISTYKIRLLEKLGANSLVDLFDFAKRHNLVDRPTSDPR